VRGLTTTLKKIFFWNYPRNTWQWDLLCVVILIFIFLTPKSWFSNSELPRNIGHPSRVVETVYLGPEDVVNAGDTSKIEQRVKAVTGRTEVEVIEVQTVIGPQNRVLGLQVDIR